MVWPLTIEGSLGGGSSSGKSRTENAPTQFSQAPEFGETAGARKSWWELLQGFSGQPGYGAIAPDWASIWENAQNKVRQYFWGSPTDPGLVGKIKASVSGRNVQDSPAQGKLLARMGATEGNILSDMATQQATQQAQFGESGRLNYLQQLQTLAGYKPEVAGYTPWQTTEEDKKFNEWSVGAKIGG